ncbi:MAG: aldehyde dehydrogenase family protein [Acidobacteria bacterium]|nr:aldehyde dehydrogenase family protein [Acidobacteriota bacterium]MCA1649184.1 aldehyde dehydrogenase family protein [Acidobacteriota bacterium]
MSGRFPFWIAGKAGQAGAPFEVRTPFDGAVVGQTWLAGDAEFDAAADAAVAAAASLRAMATYERADVLTRVSAELTARKDEIARVLAGEAGKPIKDATVEAERAAMTFQVAAEEARHLRGEVIPLDLAAHGKGRLGITRRFPIGPVAAISPFNFPLNLSAHKLAPAIAAGNPIVLKPATKTPLSALLLGGMLSRAGLPAGAVSVLPMARATGDRLVTDERFKLLTFTGSSAVGWDMKRRAGRKKIILELGGNAAVIIDDSADLELAVQRVTTGGFAFAGQSCIAVQRVYVHDRVFDDFAARLTARVEALRVGDPLDPSTDVGPMISEDELARVHTWVEEALAAGARILTGGRQIGRALYAPTVLADAPPDSKVCAEEVFAPLVGLYRFARMEEALRAVNSSIYGLQAGLFTNSLDHSFRAFDELDVGGVIVNDVPTWRIDHMPYGGVKASGLGREGPHYTIEEMTELKLLVINRQQT